jgi:RNA polymerase sigma factor (sigma-70 family)
MTADAPDAAELYRQLAPRVLGYLRAQGAREPDDVLGEVFLQVARDLPRFRDRDDAAAVRAWVFGIARHRLVDAARRERRRPRRAPPLMEDAPPAEPPDPALLAALATLTDDQREVVVLRFVADLSLEDVGALTGRTPGAVKALQHRALENLRRAVSPLDRSTL